MDPERLAHSKIARMVQHDVHFVRSKVMPEPTDNRLKIMSDHKAIHSKIFMQHEAGDGPKQSSSQAYKQ